MTKSKTTLESLARMVANGFANTATKVDIQRLDVRMDAMDARIDTMTLQINVMTSQLGFLESGQEDIKLHLDNVAYKFEVKELDRRVKTLEKKIGI